MTKRVVHYLIVLLFCWTSVIGLGCKTTDNNQETDEQVDDTINIEAYLKSPITHAVDHDVKPGEERDLEISVRKGSTPMANQLVSVVSTDGGRFLEADNSQLLTDSDGNASVTWKAGDSTGAGTISITVEDVEVSVFFSVMPFDSSDSLGEADQNSFSLSVDTSVEGSGYAVEGWAYDGEKVTLHVILADRYNHPVSEGTVVNFYAEGGNIETYKTTDENGACTVTWTSQEPRALKDPDEDGDRDGRVTIMATVKGNESFNDNNDDSLFNAGDTVTTDMSEAFLDANENGVYDVGELFLDNNEDGVFTPLNGKYNGILCGDDALCSRENIDVRQSLVIVMSGSKAQFDFSRSSMTFYQNLLQMPLYINVYDQNGNSMPADTTITVTVPEPFTIELPQIMSEGVSELQNDGNSLTFKIGRSVINLTQFAFNLVVPSDYFEEESFIESGVDLSEQLTIEAVTPKNNVTTQYIPLSIVNPGPEGDPYLIQVKMYSNTTPREEIYQIHERGTAYFQATVMYNSQVLTRELVTFSTTKGAFPLVEDGTDLTDDWGVAEILWDAETTAGAGMVTATVLDANGEEHTGSMLYEIIPVTDGDIDDDDDEPSPLVVHVELLSVLTGEPIFELKPGQRAIVNISVTQDDLALNGQQVVLKVDSGDMGTFIETSTGSISTDSTGKVTLTFLAGSETGAAIITASIFSVDYDVGDSEVDVIETNEEGSVIFNITPFDESTPPATGEPDQDSFTFYVDEGSEYAVEGLLYNGETIQLNVRVADRYNHPVEKAVVDFYTEGGAIEQSCITKENGVCSVTWYSQEPRPTHVDENGNVVVDGRVTIMAVTKGNESFVDENDNNVFDSGELFFDMPEAFLDNDYDGTWDSGEFFLDNHFTDGWYTGENGVYNGSLCNHDSCTNTLIDIRADLEIIMSGSFADIDIRNESGQLLGSSSIVSLSRSDEDTSISLTIQDENQNSMPHGTKVEIITPTEVGIKRVKATQGTINPQTTEGQNQYDFTIEEWKGPLGLSFLLFIQESTLEQDESVHVEDYVTIRVTSKKGHEVIGEFQIHIDT